LLFLAKGDNAYPLRRKYPHLLRLNSTWADRRIGHWEHLQLLSLNVSRIIVNRRHHVENIYRERSHLTLGTAAWKLTLLIDCVPETWNRARIFTTPGRAGETWGVSVIFREDFLYAVYELAGVAAGAGAGTGTGTTICCAGTTGGVNPKGDEDCNSVGEAYDEGAAGETVGEAEWLKRSRISLTAL
jgi:hypothetical protein